MKFKTAIILTVSYLLFISCGDVPVFSEMDTNRLKVVIKGTFETEGVSHFVDMNDPALGANASPIMDDSVVAYRGAPDSLPTTFMLDIAELRLNGKKFANYRQVMRASLAGDGSAVSFFNGKGIVLDNDDPAPGYYDTVQIYVRKMIFDGGKIYSGNSFEPKDPRVIFDEEYIDGGFDFNQYQQNTYVDSLRLNSGRYLRSFPIRIPIIGGLNYDRNDKETVLEIRFVIKNFVKKYERPFYESGMPSLYHFYALSDWLRDVRDGDTVFGGNLLAVARAYVPGKTGSVRVNAGAGKYVIAIPVDEDTVDYAYYMDRSVSAGTRGFDYDLPKQPVYSGAGIESLLDYFIRLEKFKYEWNFCLPTPPVLPLTPFDEYIDAWDAYDNAINKFRIAPYVGYSDSAGYVTFSNMAPGEYNFYKANRPVYGELFDDLSAFTQYVSNPVIIYDDKIAVNPDINIP